MDAYRRFLIVRKDAEHVLHTWNKNSIPAPGTGFHTGTACLKAWHNGTGRIQMGARYRVPGYHAALSAFENTLRISGCAVFTDLYNERELILYE